jgi:hypothetical protein
MGFDALKTNVTRLLGVGVAIGQQNANVRSRLAETPPTKAQAQANPPGQFSDLRPKLKQLVSGHLFGTSARAKASEILKQADQQIAKDPDRARHVENLAKIIKDDPDGLKELLHLGPSVGKGPEERIALRGELLAVCATYDLDTAKARKEQLIKGPSEAVLSEPDGAVPSTTAGSQKRDPIMDLAPRLGELLGGQTENAQAILKKLETMAGGNVHEAQLIGDGLTKVFEQDPEGVKGLLDLTSSGLSLNDRIDLQARLLKEASGGGCAMADLFKPIYLRDYEKTTAVEAQCPVVKPEASTKSEQTEGPDPQAQRKAKVDSNLIEWNLKKAYGAPQSIPLVSVQVGSVLGKGGCNTVYSATGADGSDVVVKPLVADGQEALNGVASKMGINPPPRFALRNVASTRVADALKERSGGAMPDVVCRCELGRAKLPGKASDELVLVMNKAPGKPLDEAPPGQRDDPEIVRQMTWLQLVHAITGQGDGHDGNILVDSTPDRFA